MAPTGFALHMSLSLLETGQISSVYSKHVLARRDISLKGFRGRKNKVFCSTEKANSKAKPSLPMYVTFTLSMLHKYVHMTSKLVTINSDCKSKYKAQLPTVGQIQKWILSYYLEMTKL